MPPLMIKNNRYDPGMTTLGTLVTAAGRANGKTAAQPPDIPALVASLTNGGNFPAALGNPLVVTAAMTAWTNQDDDAHDTCDALVACRNPLHPGPCKGWKHTLHSVAPHAYKTLEDERVRKANERRIKRIDDLKAQGKPIPRRLLTPIVAKPAPHPAHNAKAVPLGQVNQKADLAGGQAHVAGQAVTNSAGIQVKTPGPLPLGPKKQKPTVAGRGPAFVITQPKVTDQYKLDKAAKITPDEWNALSDADKKTIRDEITAIKGRGFGPQQKKADELLAKLPEKGLAPGSTNTITTPKGNVHQVINVAPGKTTLGQATKTVPPKAPSAPAPAAPSAPAAPTVPSGGKSQKHVYSVTYNGVKYTRTSARDYTHVSIVQKGHNGDKVVWGFHGSEANAHATPLTSMQKQNGFKVVDVLPVTKEPVKGSKAAAPSTPSPAKPGALSPDAQQARAVAGRAVGRPTSKQHLDTYGKLTKDDFDSLDATTQRTIRDDLANAKAKFLDPKKQQAAQDLLDRFGSRHPAAPATPGPAKGYSDPQNEAMKAVRGVGNTDGTLKAVGRLSPDAVKGLDDADRKTLLSRLAFIATHPKATPDQKDKAAAYGRIINGRNPADGTTLPDGTKLDHTASLGQIHAAEKAKGTAAVAKAADAVNAAKTPTISLPGAARDAHVAKMTALSKREFDGLKPDDQRAILTNLQEFHGDNSGYGKTHTPASTAAGEAITKFTGHHPAIARVKQAEADFRAGRLTPRQVWNEAVHAAVQTPVSGPDRVAFDAEKQRIAEDNPSLPLWLRSSLIDNPYSGGHGRPYDVIGQLSMEHSWKDAPRLGQSDMRQLFASTDADLANTHPIHREAIKAYREHVVSTGLAPGSPWSSATKNQLVDSLLNTNYGSSPVVTDDRMKMFHELDQASQMKVRTALADRILSQTNPHAKTATNITLRQLQGHPFIGVDLDAALAATDRFAGTDKQETYRKLTTVEFQALPQYTQEAINTHLDDLQTRAEQASAVTAYGPTSNALKVFPAALKGKLNGTRNSYIDRRERNAADVANYGTKIVKPEDRIEAYRAVPIAAYRNMDVADKAKIKDDLTKIGNDPANPLEMRFQALFTKDFAHGDANNRINANQLVAIGATDPVNQKPDYLVEAALNALPKTEYDSLDKTYQEAIDQRIKGLANPASLQLFAAKFHPSQAAANPTGMTPTTVQANVPPHVQAALDTIYGVHPKSHTMAHQLSTYGALRGHDFTQLNSQEQSHLLSDLSYIETTAKGPSKEKARKLIDRFTPAGTPSGQIPPQPVIPPANSVPGQTRYATPLTGVLVQAKDKGLPGDGWTTTPSGKRVWGKYGAAGLLLMHQDPNTGERRYLMVQRGPAISDPGKWQFPGGAIDSKETFHQGGTREVIEELGFKGDALKDAKVHGEHSSSIPGSNWKYVSVAAQVDQMLKPDLSTHHARAETSDAKWMTEAEIRKLDTDGKLLAPLAGGKLEQNVLSLFPAKGNATLGQVVRPGPVTKRQGRLAMPSGGRQAPSQFNAWPHAHKQSTGKNLVSSKTDIDALRQEIKNARTAYDGKTGDGRLAAIGAKQGFDDTPTVVSKSEMDRLLATGDYIEAWRGVKGTYGGKSAADINEDMRSGTAWYGRGIFGNGYYLATQKSVAQTYSDGRKNSVMRILIPKSAVISHYKDMQREARANSSRVSKAKGNRYEEGTLYDAGRWAAAKGVDGIQINHDTTNDTGGWARHVAKPGLPAFNWLNRAVLIIQEADK